MTLSTKIHFKYMKSSVKSILYHSLCILDPNLKLKWYIRCSKNLFAKQVIYCSLNRAMVLLIFMSETINMSYFNFISWMHDLQWGKLSRSHGSYRIRQDLSALGSADAASAQVLARKVKYHQTIFPMILFYKLLFAPWKPAIEMIFIWCFPESLRQRDLW